MRCCSLVMARRCALHDPGEPVQQFPQPAVIMLTAPLVCGAFAALWLTGTLMSIFAQITVALMVS